MHARARIQLVVIALVALAVGALWLGSGDRTPPPPPENAEAVILENLLVFLDDGNALSVDAMAIAPFAWRLVCLYGPGDATAGAPADVPWRDDPGSWTLSFEGQGGAPYRVRVDTGDIGVRPPANHPCRGRDAVLTVILNDDETKTFLTFAGG